MVAAVSAVADCGQIYRQFLLLLPQLHDWTFRRVLSEVGHLIEQLTISRSSLKIACYL